MFIGLNNAITGLTQDQLSKTINSLFSKNEQGVWYDPSDFSTMFQDAAGTTPVTAVEQPVGLILDKSKGLVLGAELIPDPTFSSWADPSVPDGWTKMATHNATNYMQSRSGGLRIVSDGTYVSIMVGGLTVGRSYEVKFDVTESVSGSVVVLMGAGTDKIVSAVGAYKIVMVANSTYVEVKRNTACDITFDNFSVRERLGNHATQSTTTSRPTLKQNASGKYYLSFDGVDDYLVTGSIDFTGTDKMTIMAGVRKLSDAAAGIVVELSADRSGSAGAFSLYAPVGGGNQYLFASKGTIDTAWASVPPYTYPTSHQAVLTGLGSISGDQSILRVNGNQVAQSTGDQGTGNYGNYPLYIGRRGGTTFPFNGQLYGLVIRGALSSTGEIQGSESYMNLHTGAY